MHVDLQQSLRINGVGAVEQNAKTQHANSNRNISSGISGYRRKYQQICVVHQAFNTLLKSRCVHSSTTVYVSKIP